MSKHLSRWLVSAAVHAAALFALLLFHIERENRIPIVQVLSELSENLPDEDFLETIPNLDQEIDLTAAVSLSAASPSRVASDVSMSPANEARSLADSLRREQDLIRPLASAPGKLELGSTIKNLHGVSVTSGGDAGSVDHITLEILRQLEKGKVLVAWVMDASGSLAQRREDILKRFDRIYHELDTLDKNDALLTGIVAFGQRTVFMTAKPTDNQEVISQAVRSIKADESGIENAFSAVRETALKWRSYQTHGRRTLMIIVLTDEIGDDPAILDETVDLMKRNRVMVYVMGPMAPFGRKEISVNWIDPPTGEAFSIPIERGPESVQSEHLALPYWFSGPQFDLFPSGFGPYGLTRLARETGGIYFLYDDGNVPGQRFSDLDLLPYRPDYVSYSQYSKLMNANPLRAAVIRAVDESNGAIGTPPMLFIAEGIAPRLMEGQRVAETTRFFVEKALSNLRAYEKDREKETSRRWQAHYDLIMGRLLAAKVRCNEYNWRLAQMRLTPRVPKGKDKNAWQLIGSKEIVFGIKEVPDKDEAKSNVRKVDPKENTRAKEDAEKAMAYLQRVVKEHANTPWAMMADRELKAPLGFDWQEASLPPPPKPGERPTPQQQAEMNRMQRRAEAAKRVPKL